MPLPRTRVRRALATGLALLLVLGACSGDDDDAAPTTTTTTKKSDKPRSTTTTKPPEPTTTTIVPENQSLVAIAKGDSIRVYDKPKAKKPKDTITAAEAVTVPGVTPIAFLGDKIDDGWLKAYLPIRPNGSMGWLRRKDVQESVHNYSIEVELAAHHMRVFRGDKVIVSVDVGVGREDRPTPGGVYYIKELLQPPDANSVYGSFAYGLSGYSTVLESFNGGSGVIGLHGTNDPSSIGKNVSSGCIRMRNEVIERLVNRIGLPLGTPVDIKK